MMRRLWRGHRGVFARCMTHACMAFAGHVIGVKRWAALVKGGVFGLLMISVGGCSLLASFQPSVAVEPMTPGQYIALQRGDILTSGQRSAATAQVLRVSGLDVGACAVTISACLTALAQVTGMSQEQRVSSMAELWLEQALTAARAQTGAHGQQQTFLAAMEAARYAYAYLFMLDRTPGARVFEDRQTQVKDWYNVAVQLAVTTLFDARQQSMAGSKAGQIDADSSGMRAAQPSTVKQHPGATILHYGGWILPVEMADVRSVSAERLPQELLPASSLAFHGLRSTYRRDGIGAELVAVLEESSVSLLSDAGRAQSSAARRMRHEPPAFTEMSAPNLTVLLLFEGNTLQDVLGTRVSRVVAYDPFEHDSIQWRGQRVPLAANFTAGYGLWLARSQFSSQALRTLLGRDDGIDSPHLYMMQPFDPDRRIILMLHGLASSPEAWVNVANEVLGDERLREAYQIWQLYYPTSVPVAINHIQIRRLVTRTLHHFDPECKLPASQAMVLIGHSMGGMIARLMVSGADEQLWRWMRAAFDVTDERRPLLQERLDPMLRFAPMPGVTRAIFIAAPHRGTKVAGERLARWASRLINLPITLMEKFDEAMNVQGDGTKQNRGSRRIMVLPTSIDNLNENDGFVQAAAELPISPRVRYHSIIARKDGSGALKDATDGLVPYYSAHLPGATSELIIEHGHSVQETPEAILEIRRILHEALEDPPNVDSLTCVGFPH